MRCVIIGGVRILDASLLRGEIREDDLIVCCDGGIYNADTLGVTPDLIIGDFDSSEMPDINENDEEDSPEVIILPREKDDTDTMYAVKECLGRGFDDFLLLGVTGGRLDHTLGNVGILLYLQSRGVSARIADELSELCIAADEPVFIENSWSYFSVINISGTARDISITDAKYPLSGAEISCEYQYGISNEVLPGKTAQVSVGDGRALIVKIR